MRFVRAGEYALNTQPDRCSDQGGGIIDSGRSDEGERQKEGEDSVCDDQTEQPRQEMQGGAEGVAEALKRRQRGQEWHHGGPRRCFALPCFAGGAWSGRRTDSSQHSSQGMMIAGGVMMVLAGAGSLLVGESRPGPRFSNNKKDDMQLITDGRSPRVLEGV